MISNGTRHPKGRRSPFMPEMSIVWWKRNWQEPVGIEPLRGYSTKTLLEQTILNRSRVFFHLLFLSTSIEPTSIAPACIPRFVVSLQIVFTWKMAGRPQPLYRLLVANRQTCVAHNRPCPYPLQHFAKWNRRLPHESKTAAKPNHERIVHPS